jgi:hypothetical protein
MKIVRKTKNSMPAIIKLVMVLVVMFVGAFGYQYAMNYKAKVAMNPSTKQIAAETMTIPEIKSAEDLTAASKALDTASIDNLSADDLDKLANQVNNF